MEERDVLEKIAESAQDMEVPDALEPGQIKKQLKGSGHKNEKRKLYRTVVAAACLCLCFGAGGLAWNYTQHEAGRGQGLVSQKGGGPLSEDAGAMDQAEMLEGHADTAGSVTDMGGKDGAMDDGKDVAVDADGEDGATATGEKDRAVVAVQDAPVKRLGSMYKLASDYGEVYDVLEEARDLQREQEDRGVLAGATNGIRADSDSFAQKKAMADSASREESVMLNGKYEGMDDSCSDFSTTNLQVEGVDESDIVKTDGKFLYVVQDARIRILNVQDRMPAMAGTIKPDMDEDTDTIREMYVANQILTVIIQTERTSLRQGQEEDAAASGSADEGSQSRKYPGADVQYMETAAVTKVITYDIANPRKPVQRDVTDQDGWYQTSRKVGNRLYLFTNQPLGLGNGVSREEALTTGALKSWLPAVNGTVVRADSIYLPKQGSQGLLMASIDLAGNHQVLDTKLLVNNYAELYVSSNSVYLYHDDYTNGSVRTRIARFALESDGTIRAIAAKTVKGSIRDTFAVHEREGYLQVLTSVTSSEPWENRVYVLDGNMETVGKLTGLAKGEQIYAARFVGKIGYFVTYRNTDPLFTVDFSNPKKPKAIGELQVSGFSEYLHFWSDDRLLGIGYETDANSGQQMGVKLSMFDISNPEKVKEEARLVVKEADRCEGMYDYKTVLVNLKKNVIALTTESYRDKYREEYRVFSYVDGKFVSQATRILAAGNKEYEDCHWRSVYVGGLLYLVCEKKVIVFDMEDGWKEIGKLKYGRKGNTETGGKVYMDPEFNIVGDRKTLMID